MANSVDYVSYQHAAGGSEDFEFHFAVTVTGNYVEGTGEAIDFLTAANPNGLELGGFLPANGLDVGVPDFSASVEGYGVGVSAYNAGSAVMKFYSAPGTELASGAYPAGITGGQVNFTIRHRG